MPCASGSSLAQDCLSKGEMPRFWTTEDVQSRWRVTDLQKGKSLRRSDMMAVEHHLVLSIFRANNAVQSHPDFILSTHKIFQKEPSLSWSRSRLIVSYRTRSWARRRRLHPLERVHVFASHLYMLDKDGEAYTRNLRQASRKQAAHAVHCTYVKDSVHSSIYCRHRLDQQRLAALA